MRTAPPVDRVVAEMGRLIAVHLVLALMVCLLLAQYGVCDPTSPSTVHEPDDTLATDA